MRSSDPDRIKKQSRNVRRAESSRTVIRRPSIGAREEGESIEPGAPSSASSRLRRRRSLGRAEEDDPAPQPGRRRLKADPGDSDEDLPYSLRKKKRLAEQRARRRENEAEGKPSKSPPRSLSPRVKPRGRDVSPPPSSRRRSGDPGSARRDARSRSPALRRAYTSPPPGRRDSPPPPGRRDSQSPERRAPARRDRGASPGRSPASPRPSFRKSLRREVAEQEGDGWRLLSRDHMQCDGKDFIVGNWVVFDEDRWQIKRLKLEKDSPVLFIEKDSMDRYGEESRLYGGLRRVRPGQVRLAGERVGERTPSPGRAPGTRRDSGERSRSPGARRPLSPSPGAKRVKSAPGRRSMSPAPGRRSPSPGSGTRRFPSRSRSPIRETRRGPSESPPPRRRSLLNFDEGGRGRERERGQSTREMTMPESKVGETDDFSQSPERVTRGGSPERRGGTRSPERRGGTRSPERTTLHREEHLLDVKGQYIHLLVDLFKKYGSPRDLRTVYLDVCEQWNVKPKVISMPRTRKKRTKDTAHVGGRHVDRKEFANRLSSHGVTQRDALTLFNVFNTESRLTVDYDEFLADTEERFGDTPDRALRRRLREVRKHEMQRKRKFKRDAYDSDISSSDSPTPGGGRRTRGRGSSGGSRSEDEAFGSPRLIREGGRRSRSLSPPNAKKGRRRVDGARKTIDRSPLRGRPASRTSSRNKRVASSSSSSSSSDDDLYDPPGQPTPSGPPKRRSYGGDEGSVGRSGSRRNVFATASAPPREKDSRSRVENRFSRPGKRANHSASKMDDRRSDSSHS